MSKTPSMADLVRRALDESANIDSKNIVCSIDGGDLVLEGWVASYAERLAVLDVASSVEGVTVVHSYLVVKLNLAGRHRTDSEVRADIAEVLDALGVLANEVQFTVHQHVVTLAGEVERGRAADSRGGSGDEDDLGRGRHGGLAFVWRFRNERSFRYKALKDREKLPD